ncbi:hypothetical protein DFH09DRAFT_982308 [Mycena vulgaris]|nr:hypothetical protein DFH09DRAFT_982308 [Mycena vulgaris]
MALPGLLAHQFFGTASRHSLDARGPGDSCNDINNCRGLFGIVWGCLITVFALTWVSVRPNVPSPDQSRLMLFWRRLGMMALGVLAPELMVGFAARQFLTVRMLSKKFGFSRPHAFFFAMGGFVSQIGRPITTVKQLEDPVLGPEYLLAIQKIKVADIMDKSKGDALSKGAALAQGLWFTAHALARVSQRLLVTKLEIATLAFVGMHFLTWLLWQEKPLDVQQPIVVGPAEELTLKPAPTPPHLDRLNNLAAEEKLPESVPPPPPLDKLTRLSGVLIGYYGDYDPGTVATSVPPFWSMEENVDGEYLAIAFLIECLVGIIFGAIHCAAWNTHFPSTAEIWMWRACSVSVTALPVSFPLCIAFWPGFEDEDECYGDEPVIMGMAGGLVIYAFARISLIVLAFTTLRTASPGAFTDLNWGFYI